MINEETFVEYLEKIRKYIKQEEEIDSALKKLSPDFGGFSLGDILSDMCNLLAICSHDSEWIDYYVWETNFGERFHEIYENNGATAIPFKTPDDVYNVIKGEYEADLDKYKRLYQNEKEHNQTLEKIISIVTKDSLN